MTTTVTGAMVREIGMDTFADITEAQIIGWPRDGITFDGDLTPEQVAAIRERMCSRDDVDQARRADLRAKRDAVVGGATLENVAALAVAEANYMLGD